MNDGPGSVEDGVVQGVPEGAERIGALHVETWIMPAVIGVSVAVGLAIANGRQRKKNAALSPGIVENLQSGEMTLPDLASAMGHGSFLGRGKVTLALNELVESGAVTVIPAPDGTPQMKKVDYIQYRLEGGAERVAAS